MAKKYPGKTSTRYSGTFPLLRTGPSIVACWASHTVAVPNSGPPLLLDHTCPHAPSAVGASRIMPACADLELCKLPNRPLERKMGTDVALAAVAGFMEYVVNQRRRAAEKYTASATRASPRSKRDPTPRISLSVPRPTRDLSEMASQTMPNILRVRGVGGRRRRRRSRNWLNFLVL